MNTEVESTITVTEVEGDALHRQYRGQGAPQPCFVELDCDTDTLSAAYNPEIGNGVPVAVWHNRAVRWPIPALTAESANGLLAEILPEAERVLAGYECVWDGHNHVGRYTEDAREAIEAVQSQSDRDWDGQTIEVWDAGDWYGAVGGHDSQRHDLGITAATTDDELAAIETREDGQAHPRVIEGLAHHLTMLRDEAIEQSDED